MPILDDLTYFQSQIASLARGELYQTVPEGPPVVWVLDQRLRPVQVPQSTDTVVPFIIASADPWLVDTWDKISKHIGLSDDWDGAGSPAPSRELLDSAYALAVLLTAKPQARRPVFAVDAAGRPGFAAYSGDLYLHLTVDAPGAFVASRGRRRQSLWRRSDV